MERMLGEQVKMLKRDLRLAGLLGFLVIRTLVSTLMDVFYILSLF